jgi:hypothetical protein
MASAANIDDRRLCIDLVVAILLVNSPGSAISSYFTVFSACYQRGELAVNVHDYSELYSKSNILFILVPSGVALDRYS